MLKLEYHKLRPIEEAQHYSNEWILDSCSAYQYVMMSDLPNWCRSTLHQTQVFCSQNNIGKCTYESIQWLFLRDMVA